ncbi:ATP-dependent DNA helicase [Aneurinibacillus sp. Ricciae_BoGa-3]|uniref:ATP-dependent DNA helicase n=1 Tax=Aneurinibacillus sp. Ricciae_BoGa-3 TaxID=3022697 RepID=UPI00233FE973|nr:ATP-dependent DNA helicase [Aneurinibacillus sp. Ricciae_BoGa-3]WCK52699.1 ATP-dependent DNA helicase [Aneurinibacillus sp. Ricciae_BoGa-3]
MITLPSSLNDEQRQAVLTTEGPLLIIAGPGSGKTFTLVERICYLIAGKKIQPERIMVTTFTEKAARELITRISERLNEEKIEVNVNHMHIGTLHSICLSLLEKYREHTTLERHFTVMEQFEQQYFLYQRLDQFRQIPAHESILIKARQIEPSRWKQAYNLMGWLNKVSEEALDYEQMRQSDDARVQALGEMYALYRRQMKEENKLDFSTIQVETLHLLENNPEVLSQLQDTIEYIMFDEYQDTNTIQETIVKKLAEKHGNLCVVGDDDQGLYRFRGASVRNILAFSELLPNKPCSVVRLTTNYRSHPDIIDFYNRWMREKEWTVGGQSYRLDKNMRPSGGNFPQTASVIKVPGFKGRGNWEEEVYAFLIHLKESGALTDWNQVAFLFRSVRYPAVERLAKHLENRGIPVYAPRAGHFFSRQEIRFAMGALLTMFPQNAHIRRQDPLMDLAVWDEYDRFMEEFQLEANKAEHAELREWVKVKAREHEAMHERTDYGFSGLFYQLIQFPMFSRYINPEGTDGVIESRPARNLALFSQLLTRFEDLQNMKVFTPAMLETRLGQIFNEYLFYLMEDGVVEYEDESDYAPSGCVSFLTIHQSKGMEFPVVFVCSLDSAPYGRYEPLELVLQKQYSRQSMHEPFGLTASFDFWRLYYTAFSRAQHLLILSGQERAGKPGTWPLPSEEFLPYYREIPSWKHPAFQAESLELPTVREVKLKKQYAFSSHLFLYESCPRRYLFYRQLQFSPVRTGITMIGTLIHNTIEEIHKAVLRGDEQSITEPRVREWLEDIYYWLSRKEHIKLRMETKEYALAQVMRYVEDHRNEWRFIESAETEVAHTTQRYVLNGRIDLVRRTGDDLEIVDFKSQHKLSGSDGLEMYRKQLELYAYLLEKQEKRKIQRLSLYFTREEGNPYYTFERTAEGAEHALHDIERIIENIENKFFSLTHRPEKVCESCDFRFYCDSLDRVGGGAG